MTYYACDVIGDGDDQSAEGAFRPAIAELTDSFSVVVDARADDTVATGKMLVKAAPGLSGTGVFVMRKAMLSSEYGMPENGFQDDADDPDLARHLGRRGLLRRWLASIDFPVTMNTTLGSLPGTLAQLRNRVLALQPGMTFNGLTGSSTVGQALAVVLPQINFRLEPRQVGQSGTFTDNFNGEVSTVDLASHVPSGGTAWTRSGGAANHATVSSASFRLINNTNDATGALYQCDDQGSADQYVQGKHQGTSVLCFVCNRASDGSNYIGWRVQGSPQVIHAYKRSGGTHTLLGSGSTTAVSGDLGRLESSGNDHTAYLKGVAETGPHNDALNNTVTRQGVNPRANGGSAQAWLDDFEAGVLGGGATPSIPVPLVGWGGGFVGSYRSFVG